MKPFCLGGMVPVALIMCLFHPSSSASVSSSSSTSVSSVSSSSPSSAPFAPFASGLDVRDSGSGCPSDGCLPSGTFSLSSDVPGAGNQAVATRWMSLVSGSSPGGGGSGTAGPPSRLGCVSSMEGVVCATNSGYVALDQLKGGVVWRYDDMTSPSLPIMDDNGDVIGTDGKILVQITASGEVLPVINMTKYADYSPMYSIQLANDALFLMLSAPRGEFITYNTNGIVEASLFIHATVQRVNGTFLPIAQPVIFGKRAYVLMQFRPDSQDAEHGVQVLGLQRLYAIDLWARIVDRIAPVWYFNFQRESAATPCPNEGFADQPPTETGSVLVHNDTVYVSLGGPEAACRRSRRHGDASPDDGMLWAFRDTGSEAQLLFKVAAPVSRLSLYDVSLGAQPLQPHAGAHNDDHNSSRKSRKTSASSSAAQVLWASNSTHISGYNSLNGALEHVIDVSRLLNATCRITSRVMVARSKDDNSERLVYAVSVFNTTTEFQTNSSVPYVVTLTVDANRGPQLLWKVAGKPGTQVVGQMANVLLVPPGPRPHRPQSRSPDVLRWTSEQEIGRADHGGVGGGGKDIAGRENTEVETFLVGTAISDTEQYSFAIGPKA